MVILDDIQMMQEERPGQIDAFLSDIIHSVAYNGEPLGR